MIKLKDIYKNFGKVEVLKGVSFDHKQGEVLTILGPNSSGKTTLIKVILGMVIPQKGEVYIDGELVNGKYQYRNTIDYLPQIARFPDNLTVQELVNLIKEMRDTDSREKSLIEMFNLTPFLKQKLNNLSGGTKQKVNLVLAFMFDSPVVILDEPTTGLDPVSLISLKKLIKEEKERGKVIIVTTHILSFVEEMADQIVFLLEGKLHFKGSVNMLKLQTNQKDIEHSIASVMKANHA